MGLNQYGTAAGSIRVDSQADLTVIHLVGEIDAGLRDEAVRMERDFDIAMAKLGDRFREIVEDVPDGERGGGDFGRRLCSRQSVGRDGERRGKRN